MSNLCQNNFSIQIGEENIYYPLTKQHQNIKKVFGNHNATIFKFNTEVCLIKLPI